LGQRKPFERGALEKFNSFKVTPKAPTLGGLFPPKGKEDPPLGREIKNPKKAFLCPG